MIRPTPKLKLSVSSVKREKPVRESPRGVYEAEFSAPNQREFHVVNSHGVRIMNVQIDEQLNEGVFIAKRLWELLDEIEPVDGADLRLTE